MHMKLANYTIKDLLQDFKPNLTLLNKIIYATATIINARAITHKKNSSKKAKCNVRIQKVIDGNRGKISLHDEMGKGV